MENLANQSSLHNLVMSPRIDEGLRVELMSITPDLAMKWLKRNHINRPIQRKHVQALVAAIRDGQWDDANGETIIFGATGNLLDGQHRLTAVVEAQHQIVSLVVFGVEESKRGTIDTGNRRLLGHFMGMMGKKNGITLAATLSYLHAWEEGTLLADQHGLPFKTYQEGMAFYAAHPGIEDSVSIAKNRVSPLISGAQGCMLHWLFAQKDAKLAQVWVDTLHDGREREGYENFFVLRERLIKQHRLRDKLHVLECSVYAIKAWNATRRGVPIRVFKWFGTEPIPKII